MKKHRLGLVLCAALLMTAGSARADTIYTSQAAFNAAAAGSTTYSIPAPVNAATNNTNEIVSNPYTIGPLTFGGGYEVDLWNDRYYGVGQTYLGDFTQTATVTLDGADGLGFTIGSFDGPESVAITVNGSLIDTISLNQEPNSTFFGVISDTPITSIDFTQSLAAFQPPSAEFDVLNFSATPTVVSRTPEASTWVFLCTGMVLLAVGRRRFLQA